MTIQTYFVIQAAEYVKKTLSGSKYGTVHSVYRKTINLQFDGKLLALQAKDSPLSPISLITQLTAKEMEELNLCSGMPATILRSSNIPDGTFATIMDPPETDSSVFCIQIGQKLIFSLKSAAYFDLRLSCSLSEKSLFNLEKLCLETLRLRSTGSLELLFINHEKAIELPFLKAADLRLTAAKTAMKSQNWEEAADSLRCLIGLGLGLTPSGDDFLCGVLAGLIFCGLNTIYPPKVSFSLLQTDPASFPSAHGHPNHPFSVILSQQIQECLYDTNDISSAFLHCALEGQYSLAVNQLPHLKSTTDILSVFSEIGHSSGTDTLCGIYFILKNRKLLS